MKPQASRKRTAGTASKANLTKISKQPTEIHLMQAQLNLLKEQANRPAPLTHVAWSGKSREERAQGLLTRRAQLSKKMTKA